MSLNPAERVVIDTLTEIVAYGWEEWAGEKWFPDLTADDISCLGLGEDAWKSLKRQPRSDDPVLSAFLAGVRRLDPSREFFEELGESLYKKYRNTH